MRSPQGCHVSWVGSDSGAKPGARPSKRHRARFGVEELEGAEARAESGKSQEPDLLWGEEGAGREEEWGGGVGGSGGGGGGEWRS
jgi:hypothetical protein